MHIDVKIDNHHVECNNLLKKTTLITIHDSWANYIHMLMKIHVFKKKLEKNLGLFIFCHFFFQNKNVYPDIEMNSNLKENKNKTVFKNLIVDSNQAGNLLRQMYTDISTKLRKG